jgi:hypothetical protein
MAKTERLRQLLSIGELPGNATCKLTVKVELQFAKCFNLGMGVDEIYFSVKSSEVVELLRCHHNNHWDLLTMLPGIKRKEPETCGKSLIWTFSRPMFEPVFGVFKWP